VRRGKHVDCRRGFKYQKEGVTQTAKKDNGEKKHTDHGGKVAGAKRKEARVGL